MCAGRQARQSVGGLVCECTRTSIHVLRGYPAALARTQKNSSLALFGVLPLTDLPKSARLYLFTQSVKMMYFCSGLISVDPNCPQPGIAILAIAIILLLIIILIVIVVMIMVIAIAIVVIIVVIIVVLVIVMIAILFIVII